MQRAHDRGLIALAAHRCGPALTSIFLDGFYWGSAGGRVDVERTPTGIPQQYESTWRDGARAGAADPLAWTERHRVRNGLSPIPGMEEPRDCRDLAPHGDRRYWTSSMRMQNSIGDRGQCAHEHETREDAAACADARGVRFIAEIGPLQHGQNAGKLGCVRSDWAHQDAEIDRALDANRKTIAAAAPAEPKPALGDFVGMLF